MVIRAIGIFDSYGNQIFYENYANFAPNFPLLNRIFLGMREHFVKEYDSVDLGQYRIAILNTSDFFVSILADRVNSNDELKRVVQAVNESAIEILRSRKASEVSKENVDALSDKITDIIKMLPVKCTLTGYGGVGKTTIVKLVTKGITVSRHIPTILADVEELKIEEIEPFKVTLFTVAGQPEYWRTWMLTAEGSDFVILITDSSREDVERLQKEILPYIMKITPYSRLIIIANKQDLPDRLPPSVIEELTGFPAYRMVAISPEAKERFIEILTSMIKLLP